MAGLQGRWHCMMHACGEAGAAQTFFAVTVLDETLAAPGYELSVTASYMPGTGGGGVRCLQECMAYVCRADLSLPCL